MVFKFLNADDTDFADFFACTFLDNDWGTDV